MIEKYKIVTLCGSTRFRNEFIEVQKRLTLDGNIVISVGLFGHSGDNEVWTENMKSMLDDMHLRKIDMADEIFVINPGGYIGESTKREIKYAEMIGRTVRYLENIGIIDTESNPFARRSWIAQGYPFTPHRQSLFLIVIGQNIDNIRNNYNNNEGNYVAFVAIRWGFAEIVEGILIPTVKWKTRPKYDGFGMPNK